MKGKHKKPSPSRGPNRAPAPVRTAPRPASEPPASEHGVPAPRRQGAAFRLWPLAALFALQALFLLLVCALAVFYAPPGAIIPLDLVVLPGAESRLAARIEREKPFSFSRGVPGREVIFETIPAGEETGASVLGRAMTDAAGEAALPWSAPQAAGLHRYRVRVSDPEAFPLERNEAEIVVRVVPSGGTLLLAVARETLEEADPTLDEEAPAVVDPLAQQSLKELARRSAIVYIGARPGDVPSRLRSWLEENAFPPGPVAFWPAHGRLASEQLSPWKDHAWGICRRESEAERFASAGVRAILLEGENSLLLDGRKIFAARGWAEARSLIEKNL